jgi:hypothetical protein
LRVAEEVENVWHIIEIGGYHPLELNTKDFVRNIARKIHEPLFVIHVIEKEDEDIYKS